MGLTVVVTRNADGRTRGFLASVMLEAAPGVYVSPRLSRAVRERVWAVLAQWHGSVDDGGMVMLWRAKHEPGGVGVEILGCPPRKIVDIDGLLLTQRDPNPK